MATLKRKSLSVPQKLEILDVYDKNVGKKQSEIASQMGIPPSTLRTILSNRTKIEEMANQSKFTSARKWFQTAKYDNVETALLTWMQQARANNITVSGPMLHTKAISLAEQFGYSTEEFKCSSGWLSRFKERHGIACCKNKVRILFFHRTKGNLVFQAA